MDDNWGYVLNLKLKDTVYRKYITIYFVDKKFMDNFYGSVSMIKFNVTDYAYD
jgi:hypothetical protein